jgi:hypothetical protein
VPHSQCSLKENPKNLQNYSPKHNTLRNKFKVMFLFEIDYFISGLAFKNKNYYIITQNCVDLKRQNFQNLRQKCK